MAGGLSETYLNSPIEYERAAEMCSSEVHKMWHHNLSGYQYEHFSLPRHLSLHILKRKLRGRWLLFLIPSHSFPEAMIYSLRSLEFIDDTCGAVMILTTYYMPIDLIVAWERLVAYF